MKNITCPLFAILIIAISFAIVGCSDPVSAMEPTTTYTQRVDLTSDYVNDEENPQHDTCGCHADHNTVDNE